MNRSDEVKIKDLPIAEQFNANDHMIIDDGTVARKFKMGTLQEQLQTNIQTNVDKNVTKTLDDYTEATDIKLANALKEVDDKNLVLETNIDTKLNDTLKSVDAKVESINLPFFMKNGQLLVGVKEEESA